MDMEEVGMAIAVASVVALGLFANKVTGGSWPKGAGVVVAVGLPLAIITDVVSGGPGFGSWIVAALGIALMTHFFIFLLGSPRENAEEQDAENVERENDEGPNSQNSIRKGLRRGRDSMSEIFRRVDADVRLLDGDPLAREFPEDDEDENGTDWMEIDDGPIKWFNLSSRHWHFYVPDTGLSSYPELGYREVYSVLRRRFPAFGRVEDVQWFIGGPYELEPEDERFYEEVHSVLQKHKPISEAIMTAELDEVEVYIDRGCWVICDKYSGYLNVITQPLWDCYQAVANALLSMPLPTEE